LRSGYWQIRRGRHELPAPGRGSHRARHRRLADDSLPAGKDALMQLFPEQASALAGRVDALYFFLIGISVFFSLLIAGLVIYFAVKYRRRSDADPIPKQQTGGTTIEILWNVIQFAISMVIFYWEPRVFFSIISLLEAR